MAKKEYKQFPGIVCEKLRNLVAVRKDAEGRRDAMFDSRDAAKDKVAEVPESDAKKREHALADYGRCVMEIGRLQRAIRKLNRDIDSLVTNPDQDELFDTASVKLDDYLREDREEDDEGGGEAGPRPIGRNTARDPAGNTAGRAISDGYVDGVDEHLRAATAELAHYGVSAAVCAKVTALKFETIAQLAAAADEDSIEKGLESLKPADAKAVVTAVRKYRTAHRKAAMAAGREAGVI